METSVYELQSNPQIMSYWNEVFRPDNTNTVTCSQYDVYWRSIDGRCNNLRHPDWGMASRSLKRLLVPEYADRKTVFLIFLYCYISYIWVLSFHINDCTKGLVRKKGKFNDSFKCNVWDDKSKTSRDYVLNLKKKCFKMWWSLEQWE